MSIFWIKQHIKFNTDGAGDIGASGANRPGIIYSQSEMHVGAPDASAALTVSSTTKGFLAPRVTTTQRDAISSPAAGLLIYNTSTTRYEFYNGSSWAAIDGGSGDINNGGNSFGSDITIGTNDAFALKLETNNVTQWRIDNDTISTLYTPDGASGREAFIKAGDGSGTGGTGGNFTIQAGASTAADGGQGGDFSLAAGDSASDTNPAGTVTINAGGATSAVGGDAGSVNINSGSANAGNAGELNLVAGNAADTGQGGHIRVTAGDSTNGLGGEAEIKGGVGGGGNGNIQFYLGGSSKAFFDGATYAFVMRDQHEIHLRELTTNGTSAVKLRAAASMAADYTITFPAAAPASNTYFKYNGTDYEWDALTTDDVSEGSNLYFTDERAQDAVGTILTDTASIDFTYNDAGNQITADVLPAGVDHNALANLTTGDAHTQYALLAGRSGGQTLKGDTAASGNLTLESTAHATKGTVLIASGSKFQTGSRVEDSAIVSTTDATVTDIYTFTLPTNTAYIVEVCVIGRKDDGTDQAMFKKVAGVYRNAGSAALDTPGTSTIYASDSTLDCDIVVSSNDFKVQVTGIAATNVDWRAQVSYTKL